MQVSGWTHLPSSALFMTVWAWPGWGILTYSGLSREFAGSAEQCIDLRALDTRSRMQRHPVWAETRGTDLAAHCSTCETVHHGHHRHRKKLSHMHRTLCCTCTKLALAWGKGVEHETSQKLSGDGGSSAGELPRSGNSTRARNQGLGPPEVARRKVTMSDLSCSERCASTASGVLSGFCLCRSTLHAT